VDRARDAASGEDVGDLADPHDLAPGRDETIEHGRARRLEGPVPAIVRAHESSGRTDERSRDHAAHSERAREVAGDLADGIEPFEIEALRVRSDLEHAVRARVDDRLARGEVLRAEALDHLGARSRPVAQHAGECSALDEAREDLRRETLGKDRESVLERAPHHLPVARRRVLARRALGHASEGSAGVCRARERGDAVDATEAERGQARDLGRAREQCDVVERVRSLVARTRGIRKRAHSERIEHQHEDSSHRASRARLKPFQAPCGSGA
jgi:hypothetical protein